MENNKTALEMTRDKYSDKWDVEFQQVATRVEQYTEKVPDVSGERYEFPSHGGTDMREYTGSFKDITFDSIKHGKRSMRKRKFYNAIPLSVDERMDMDTLDMNFSIVMQEQVKAARRMADAVALGVIQDPVTKKWRLKTTTDEGYLGGILGTNYAGTGGLEMKNLDLTYANFLQGKGNLIPVDYATSGTGVDKAFAGSFLDRLFYVQRRLQEMEYFDDAQQGQICVAISPAVRQELCSLQLKLHNDYGFKALGNAGSATYCDSLNVTFIVTNMLPLMDTENKAGTAVTGARMCCAWLKDRIGFGTWRDTEFTLKDVNNKVDVDHYMRCRGSFGCARKDEDSVFVLPTVESPGA